MGRKKMWLVVLMVACYAIWAAGSAPISQAASSKKDAIQVMKKAGVGSYLADSKGMTLYYFKKDSPGKSACAGPCVEKWPLFHVDKISVKSKLKAKDFGQITRDDGKMQTTYKGYPLYYFVNDKKPADTAGQGVNEVWFVVDPAKFKP
ncbi:MAG: hypothetical protein WAW37_15445 [Syntrophobacteraceae bacterium]